VQAKNDVKALLLSREMFLFLVDNFASSPKTLEKGQVVGESESVSLWPEGNIEKDLRREMKTGDELESLICGFVPHLTEDDTDRLIQTLTPS
jgi:hypothetical protein